LKSISFGTTIQPEANSIKYLKYLKNERNVKTLKDRRMLKEDKIIKYGF